MGFKPILSGMICLLLVLGAFAPEAQGKRKRKKNGKDTSEEVTAPEQGAEEDLPPDEDVADEETQAPTNASGEGEKKSISDQLTEGESDGGMRRSNRMEFDERLVKGQAAKSGAVYLFKRVPRHLPGLVPMRRSYRRRIVQPVLGPHELKPARYSFEIEKAMKLKRQKAELDTGAPEPTAAPSVPANVEIKPEATEPESTENKDNNHSKKWKKRKKK